MKRQNENKQMKKGITLIEIILAIVLIAIILGLTIPKLMKNSQNAEIKQTISSDVKAIVEAAVLWKKSKRSNSTSGYTTINSKSLNTRLPENMSVTAAGWIPSSGLKTGDPDVDKASGVKYTVTHQFNSDAPHTANRLAFSIGMDTSNGTTSLSWSAKTSGYAIDSFESAIGSVSRDSDGDFETGDFSATAGSAAINCLSDKDAVSCIGDILID